MEYFWKFLTVTAIVFGVVCVTFLILLSLPKSRLRSYLLEVFGWATTGASAVSVISPIDPIPDFIPVFGLMDDLGAVALGICAFLLAMYQRRQRAKWDEERSATPRR